MSNRVEFEFISRVYPPGTFSVLRFHGQEGISQLFRFEIELYSDNPNLDLEPLLERPCTFRMTFGDTSRDIQGILSNIEVLQQVAGYVIYRAVLVPRLWLLSLDYANEVYLERTVPEIIESVLGQIDLTPLDYDLRLQRDYRVWPFRCQYNETQLGFISRMMEREGIYYYFAEGDDGEKLILCDHLLQQEELEQPPLQYVQAMGMDSPAAGGNLHALLYRQQRLPQTVVLRDYNDDLPSVDITGQAQVDPNGRGMVNVFGQNIVSPEEGAELAEIRAEEIRARKLVYHGDSTAVHLKPGYQFRVEGHFRDDCNRAYTLTVLEHRGCDPRAMATMAEEERRDQPAYENQFTAIPSGTQFRPPQATPRPELHGSLNAAITAEGDGQYAELDEEGRYHVMLPFDRELKHEGKSSHWIRMAQPYSGQTEGMHFPLRKGARVLLSFIGGDPDRPVITGALPNAAQPSVVNASNQTNNLIRTAAGNRIEMEDQQGRNRIKFHTGDDKTYMHLGAPNHDGDGWVVITEGMERKEIQGGQQLTVMAEPLDETGVARTITEVGNDSSTKTDAGTGSFTEVLTGIPGNDPIRITATDSDSSGDWQYREEFGDWQAIETVASDSWLYLRETAEIRFVPNGTVSGTRTITYHEVPDPAFGTTGNPTSYAFNTDSTPTTSLSVGSFPVTDSAIDADSDPPAYSANTFSTAVAVVSTQGASANGKWQYSTNEGQTRRDLPTVSTTAAMFLPDTGVLHYVPYPQSAGDKSLELRHTHSSQGEVYYTWTTENLVSVDAHSCAAPEFTVSGSHVYRLTSQPTDGKWQYKSPGASNWSDMGTGTAGQYFSDGDKIRFVPHAKSAGTLNAGYYQALSAGARYDMNTPGGSELTGSMSVDSTDLIDEEGLKVFKSKDDSGADRYYDETVTPKKYEMDTEEELTGQYLIDRRWGDQYTWTRGTWYEYQHSDNIKFVYGNRYTVEVDDDPDNLSDSSEPDTQRLINTLAEFEPTGIKEYDGDAAVTAVSGKTAWETLIAKGHARVAHHDSFNIQEGNIYDFGGYWNYNLGNAYEENLIDQSGQLNRNDTNDKAPSGGPNCGAISGSQVSVDSGSAWVSKSWGDTYDYYKGNTLEVYDGNQESYSYGNTSEHTYGGTHQEWKYTGDGSQKTLWSYSSKGINYETKHHRLSGVLLHASASNWAAGHNEAAFNFAPSSSISFNSAFSASGHVDVGASFDVGLHIGIVAEIKAFLGFKMDISTSPGWELTVNDDFWDFSGPGVETKGNKALKAQIKTLEMIQKALKLENSNADIKNALVDIRQGFQLNS